MNAGETDSAPTPWWGPFTIEEGAGGRWEVGPSTLWLYHTTGEWRVIHQPSLGPSNPDPMENRSEVTLPLSDEEITAVLEAEGDDRQIRRYSFRRTEDRIALQPALADRPVVSRPEYPLYVLPEESVTLYLSTPLWIRVVLPESGRQLQEVPSHRMSDTWFGTSTVQGELCYATRTAGRLRRERLPLRRHRALTPLQITNRATDALSLERVQLPARHLALYTTPNHVLWTQAVRMTRTEGVEGADIQIRSGPPSDVKDAELIQGPRDASKKGLFTSTFSAFGALFSS